MSEDPKALQGAPMVPAEKWQGWYREVRVACDDIAAVMEDQLKPERDRDLGVREATRLYNDGRDKLASLFAYADRGGDGGGGSTG